MVRVYSSQIPEHVLGGLDKAICESNGLHGDVFLKRVNDYVMSHADKPFARALRREGVFREVCNNR